MTEQMTPCKFAFDDSPNFDGFAYGSKWNGFDNVAVTPAVHAQVLAYFKSIGDDGESFEGLGAGADGLISYGWGFTTQIVKDCVMTDPHAICRKWVTRIGVGFHPDTRGKDYSPAMDADEIREYDADMEALFAAATDPYECAVMAMADAGLI